MQKVRELEAVIEDLKGRLEMAERELRDREERIRVTLDAANAGMWVWDLGTGWQTTPEINALFGRPADGGPIRFDEFPSLIYPPDLKVVADAWRRTVKTGEPYDQEYRIVLPDGALR
jgi:PAS domain-containing protein